LDAGRVANCTSGMLNVLSN